jgi:hypothetical protein
MANSNIGRSFNGSSRFRAVEKIDIQQKYLLL